MLVVYLDPYFLGDPLFVPGLARDVAARGEGLVLVHGSGERGERALESLGRLPTATDGVWEAEDAEGRAAVERASRQLNREVVHEMNEAGVPCVGALAGDRGLVKRGDAGPTAGRTGWAGDLARRGVALVVASLVTAEGEAVEADPARTAAVLAEALAAPLVALTTRSVGAEVELEQALAAVPDPAAVRRALGVVGAVRVGPRTLLRRPGAEAFARVDPRF